MLRIRSQCDTFLYNTTAHAGKYPMEQYSCILRDIRPSLDGTSWFIQLELKNQTPLTLVSISVNLANLGPVATLNSVYIFVQ